MREGIARARAAQKDWAKTSFAERKRVLMSLLDFVVENQDTICKVAARDSGKTSMSSSHWVVCAWRRPMHDFLAHHTLAWCKGCRI